MKAVFLDTVGLIATWDASDQWHTVAAAAWNRLLQANIPLVTTSWVLMECGNAAARRPYRRRVNALRRQLKDAGLLLEPTSDEVELAWSAFDGAQAAEAGIVDQISFVVMRRWGLQDVLSNDLHFQAAGYTTLFER